MCLLIGNVSQVSDVGHGLLVSSRNQFKRRTVHCTAWLFIKNLWFMIVPIDVIKEFTINSQLCLATPMNNNNQYKMINCLIM